MRHPLVTSSSWSTNSSQNQLEFRLKRLAEVFPEHKTSTWCSIVLSAQRDHVSDGIIPKISDLSIQLSVNMASYPFLIILYEICIFAMWDMRC